MMPFDWIFIAQDPDFRSGSIILTPHEDIFISDWELSHFDEILYFEE